MGFVLGEAGTAGLDDRVARLSLCAVERRLDRAITGPWIQALEFDGHIIHASIGRASVDSEALRYRHYSRPVRCEMLSYPALGGGEPLRSFVDHTSANPIDGASFRGTCHSDRSVAG
jgi:hypothetical protein